MIEKSSMANIASSQQNFLTNALITHISSTHKLKFKFNKNCINTYPPLSSKNLISCSQSSIINNNNHQDSSNSKKEMKLAKLAVVTLAASVLMVGCVDDHQALAAKSGGRIGGQAFRSAAPRPPPRASSPRTNNSRTNIYVNPPGAPPLVGGYGYGYGVPYYGGWGWSPFSFFSPGPSVAIGFGGGFELFGLFLFLGAAAAVLRRFTGGTRDEDDDEYY